MVLSELCFSMVQVCHFSSASLKSEFFNWVWKKNLYGYLLARLFKVLFCWVFLVFFISFTQWMDVIMFLIIPEI